jgi:hypothetical protein
MTYSQYNYLLPFQIEDYTVVSNAKTVTAQIWISKGFSVLVRIVQMATKGFCYALPDVSAESGNIFHGALGIEKSIAQRPNTSLWVFTRPAL